MLAAMSRPRPTPSPGRRRFLRRLGGAAALAGVAGLGVPRALAQGRAGTGLFFDPAFLEFVHHSGHPDSPARAAAIQAALREQGLAARLTPVDPAPAPEALEALGLVHPAAHVERIAREWPEGHAVALRTVAGMLGCLQAVFDGQVRNAFCASRPPGHHAYADGREEGFCFYNAVAVAARVAQRRHGVERVLIVDWDYHHGNGTQSAFYTDPSVLVFSTHDQYAYPGTGDPAWRGEGPGEGYNVNVHLDCGSGDAEILAAFDRELLPRAERFAPQLVLVSAGFDSRRDDLLGCFSVSDVGFAALTQRVMELADRHCGGRLVSVLEGGYNVEGAAGAAAAHVRTLLEA